MFESHFRAIVRRRRENLLSDPAGLLVQPGGTSTIHCTVLVDMMALQWIFWGINTKSMIKLYRAMKEPCLAPCHTTCITMHQQRVGDIVITLSWYHGVICQVNTINNRGFRFVVGGDVTPATSWATRVIYAFVVPSRSTQDSKWYPGVLTHDTVSCLPRSRYWRKFVWALCWTRESYGDVYANIVY